MNQETLLKPLIRICKVFSVGRKESTMSIEGEIIYVTGDVILRWYPPEANQKFGLGLTGPYQVVHAISDIKLQKYCSRRSSQTFK